jgi:hypothetical protein
MSHVKQFLLVMVFTVFTPLSFASDFEECSTERCVKIFKDFKKYAKKGHPSAMEALGNFYLVGYGTDKDTGLAMRMYKKAAKWGQGTAQYKVGLMYVSGAEGEKKASKGVSYLKKAVKNKVYEAAYVLGVFYMDGKLEEQDNEAARDWLELASEKNIYKAAYLLGNMYETQVFGEDQKAKAIPLYQKAAFKIQAARNRLDEIGQPSPATNDGEIEHIVVNPQGLYSFFDEQLETLRNTPAPKNGTGSRIAGLTCEKMLSCSSLGSGEQQRFSTELQRMVGNFIANSFRQ